MLSLVEFVQISRYLHLVMLVLLLLLVVMSGLPPVSHAMQDGLGGDGWPVPWIKLIGFYIFLLILSNLQQHNILKFGGGQAAPLPGPGGH